MARNAKKSLTSYEIAPSARRLTESLRDIGYEFHTAIADLVDNSVAAGAARVDVDVEFSPEGSWVTVSDDGAGMSASAVTEALRFGTRRSYGVNELGRYGLGLKTAPLSQCRRVTVVTRQSRVNKRVTRRTLDLDIVAAVDRWYVIEDDPTLPVRMAYERLHRAPGTVVVWEKLDRVLPLRQPNGGWARRRLESLATRTSEHLGMVFHRFIEGDVAGRDPLTITVNGEKVRPWNPFAPGEPQTVEMAPQEFEVTEGSSSGVVTMRRFVLPPKGAFSSLIEWERLSGPRKWNRQQGVYFYRASRLVHGGGWAGLRSLDEHTKLARALVDFETDLDGVFHINVAKMRVTVPSSLKQMLERPIHELCQAADHAYRQGNPTEASREAKTSGKTLNPSRTVGIALRAAAMELGHSVELSGIIELATEREPQLRSWFR